MIQTPTFRSKDFNSTVQKEGPIDMNRGCWKGSFLFC